MVHEVIDGPATGQRAGTMVAILWSLSIIACGGAPPPGPASEELPYEGAGMATESPDGGLFVDASLETGLDAVHFNGMSGQLYLSEITCGGGGFVDIDGDGDLDLYLSQGQMLGSGKTYDDALRPPVHPLPVSDRLYRNDLTSPGDTSPGDTGHRLTFTDVTDTMGLAATTYGCAMTAADFDNDGRVDLFLANLGPDQLLHNQGPDASGNVTFRDVAPSAGVVGDGMSTAAGFVDYDRDGWLDLYVGSYVAFDNSGATRCASLSGAPDYCGPGAFPSQLDHLYRNRGDGTFEEVSEAVGLRSVTAQPTLGLAVADFDGDGWPDLYLAHDGEPNHLWLNRRRADGRVHFVEQGLLAGSAVNASGASEAGMGVDGADYDDDGDFDIVVAHLIKETNTLYRNDGHATFADATDASGLGAPSLPRTSFGVAWLDYDNDGWLDLLAVSGGVVLDPELVAQGDPFPLHMENQLFHNLGAVAPSQAGTPEVSFAEVTATAGDVFRRSEVSRGVAVGDVDNDGDPDALIFNNAGPVRLLRNRVGQAQGWIGLRLVGPEPSRDLLGARAAILRRGRASRWRQAQTAGSYNASRDPRVLIGLGDDPQIDGVRVVWPDGQTEDWTGLATGRYHTLRQGDGQTVASP